MEAVKVTWMGCRLVTLENKREHYLAKYSRSNKHRQGILLRLGNALRGKAMRAPYDVTITRYGPKELDAGDNLNSSAKHIRDGVADALGVDDGDTKAVRFQYAQEKSQRYGVRVEIRSEAF